jgi:hypothetical protein
MRKPHGWRVPSHSITVLQVIVAGETFVELVVADHPMEALSNFFAKLAK